MNRFEIVLLVVFCIVTVAIAAFDIVYSIRKNGGKGTLQAAKEFAHNIILAVGLKLVTDAERQYGAGTGQLKMASAVAELFKLLPDWVAERIDEKWIIEEMESILKYAKSKWKTNPKLLGTTEKDE